MVKVTGAESDRNFINKHQGSGDKEGNHAQDQEQGAAVDRLRVMAYESNLAPLQTNRGPYIRQQQQIFDEVRQV